MYRIGDLLWRQRDALEAALFKRERALLDLLPTLVFLRRLGELLHKAGPRPTVVMGAGLSTEENLAWLKRERYDWITVRRGGEDRPEQEADLAFQTHHGRQEQV